MNPIIRKIEKLLRLAECQSGEPEGESAARLAEKLMRAHAVEMSDLSLEEQAEIDPLLDSGFMIGRLGWYAGLGWALAIHCNVKAYRQTNAYCSKTNTSGARMRIIGYKSDIEIVEYLYDVCLRQINDAYNEYRDFCLMVDGSTPGRAAAIAFKTSAVGGLSKKLQAMRNAARDDDTTGTAIVLSRLSNVKEFAKERIPNPGTFRSTASRHSNAGHRAGMHVNLSTSITGTNTKQIGSK